MYPLKQSTAITVPFFAHDVNGDGVTGLTDVGFTKRISKGGGAFAAMTVTITEMENGWYSLPLSTAHTDTLEILTVSLSHASCKRINLQFRVSARLVDDLATTSALAAVQADTDDIQTRLPAALVGGRMDSNSAVVGDKTGYALTTAEEDAIVDKVWDELRAAHVVAGSFGQGVASVQGNVTGSVGSVTGAVGSVTAAVTVGTNNDKTGYALTTGEEDAIVNKVWDELTAEARSAGSFGQLFKDDINATISSRATPAQILATPANLLATDASGRVTVGTNADKTGYSIGNGGIAALAFTAGAVDAAALATDAANEIADATLKRDMSLVTGEAARSPLNALRLLRNKRDNSSGTLTVYKEDDITSAWTGAVTQTAGNPVSAIDPV